MNIDTNSGDCAIRSAAVRRLNDAFRSTLIGGTVLMTAGVVALGAEAQAETLTKVQTFNAFNADNDPWAEHDFGEIEVAGERVFWKLDYYDLIPSVHNLDSCCVGAIPLIARS